MSSVAAPSMARHARVWSWVAASLLVTVTATLALASDLRVPIFYENGLAHSVFPPILIGVAIMTIGTELLGWTYSGLLVPGYLAPILLVQPWSALVIAVEALLTYFCVAGLSRLGVRTGWWSEFFGRERFLAILLISVGVRLAFEGFAVNLLGEAITEQLEIAFDYRNSLYSIGFVAVPLLANMLWNTGLRRAVVPVGVAIALTYLVTEYVLVAHTNFSVGSLSLIYESSAVDFTASPKAHIILLTGAYLASRANMQYGWDYNGILVPALLALMWPTPAKLLATLVEAMLVLAAARFITSRKRFQTTTIEGPRKMLLLFTISFAFKMAIDATVAMWWPGVTAIDLYAFGYLLPTLIAAKMWQRGAVNLVLIPTLRTSFTAAVVGNLVGFSLTFLPAGSALLLDPVDGASRPGFVEAARGELLETALLSRGRIRLASDSQPVDRVYPSEIEQFRAAMSLLAREQAETEAAEIRFATVGRSLEQIGYETIVFRDADGRASDLLLRERSPGIVQGWGIYLVSARPHANLVVNVPYPVRDGGAFELGLALYNRLGARALVVAGSHTSPTGRADGSEGPPTGLTGTARREFKDAAVLEIRATDADRPRLALRNELPGALDLTLLKQVVGDIEIDLNADLRANSRAGETASGFVELWMPHSGMAAALVSEVSSLAPELSILPRRTEAALFDWLTVRARAAQGTQGRTVAPSADEIVFFDEQLLVPLYAMARSEPGDADLERLQAAASMVDYDVVLLTASQPDERYVVLVEREPRARLWGTILLRLGDARPLVIEVPEPVAEGTAFELSIRLIRHLAGRVLIVPGPDVDGPGSTQGARDGASSAIFTLAHQQAQASIPAAEGVTAALALQIRSTFLSADDIGGDIVLTTGRGTPDRSMLPAPVASLSEQLGRLGYDVALYDGSRQRAVFSAGDNAERQFSNRYYPGSFAVLWAGGDVRSSARTSEDARRALEHAAALGLEALEGSFEQWMASQPAGAAAPDAEAVSPIAEIFRHYGELANIHDFEQALVRARALKLAPLYFRDLETGQGFLVLRRRGAVEHALRLSASATKRIDVSRSDPAFRLAVATYTVGKAGWLRVVP
jgi:hypothetical protein